MEWKGEVLKDSVGILNELNLDLEMRLKLSENIPWYAAVFGGIPACLLYTSPSPRDPE